MSTIPVWVTLAVALIAFAGVLYSTWRADGREQESRERDRSRDEAERQERRDAVLRDSRRAAYHNLMVQLQRFDWGLRHQRLLRKQGEWLSQLPLDQLTDDHRAMVELATKQLERIAPREDDVMSDLLAAEQEVALVGSREVVRAASAATRSILAHISLVVFDEKREDSDATDSDDSDRTLAEFQAAARFDLGVDPVLLSYEEIQVLGKP